MSTVQVVSRYSGKRMTLDTQFKIETFLFHVALFHSFDSDNAVIPE